MRSVWKDGSRSTFEFDDDAGVHSAVVAYFAGSMSIPAHAYAERIRSAKSMAINAPARQVR